MSSGLDHVTPVAGDAVEAIRRFNRFYTRRIGVLGERYLGSDLSLTEGRIVYELGQVPQASASDICRALDLDRGYVSRVLKRFEARGLLTRTVSASDGRRAHITLSTDVRRPYESLAETSRRGIASLLAPAPPDRQRALLAALAVVEDVLGGEGDAASGKARAAGLASAIELRPHRPGDIGWVIHRHAALYAEEYGWDITFEALVAEVAATFIRDFDPVHEACWIADRDGDILGSVFLVRASDELAKLRLLYVDPAARGQGLGRRLVATCTTFARERGYRRISLWTNSCLLAARGIYASSGYRLVSSSPHRSFGHDLVGETWELEL